MNINVTQTQLLQQSMTTETLSLNQTHVSREAIIKLLHRFQDLRESNVRYGDGYRDWGRGFDDGRMNALWQVLDIEAQ